MPEGYPAFASLMETIASRKQAADDKSYTSSLLQLGMKAIGSRVMEEASEFVTAAHELEPPNDSGSPELRQDLVGEAADLLYHTMVMLAHYDLDLTDVEAEVNRRFGQSDAAAGKSARKD